MQQNKSLDEIGSRTPGLCMFVHELKESRQSLEVLKLDTHSAWQTLTSEKIMNSTGISFATGDHTVQGNDERIFLGSPSVNFVRPFHWKGESKVQDSEFSRNFWPHPKYVWSFAGHLISFQDILRIHSWKNYQGSHSHVLTKFPDFPWLFEANFPWLSPTSA